MKLEKVLSMVLACMLIAGSSTPSVAKRQYHKSYGSFQKQKI